MREVNDLQERDSEAEQYPLEPRYHPVHKIPRKIYDFLASAKLAMALLVAILGCCVVGVTLWRGERAGQLIFSTLWFNALLILLVVNVACCFFGRIWYRKLTVVSFGMILFHMSFVVMFCAIVYNSLFCFEGLIRLSEGETLPNGNIESYDHISHGRFFSFSRLKGETTLVKMHTGYKVNGDDKRAAYEVVVGDGNSNKKEMIYITHNLNYRGVDYLPSKEGFTLLLALNDKEGKEVYGAYYPLQSLKQKDGSILYTSGTKDGPGGSPFPQEPMQPLFTLQVAYHPDAKKERAGEVLFSVAPLKSTAAMPEEREYIEGKAAIGETFKGPDYSLAAKEVRYWVGMDVRYEPGKPVLLGALWVGLAGMIITTIGRMMNGRRTALVRWKRNLPGEMQGMNNTLVGEK